MEFAFNEIQQMLQDSAAKFIQKEYDFEARSALISSELGYSDDHWKLFADLGWLALPFAEEYGGMGGELVDLMVLQTELGRGLVVEPFFSTTVLSGLLLQRHGSEEQKQQYLGRLIAGELKLAFAYSEPEAQQRVEDIETRAVFEQGGYVLTGHKSVVLSAPSADLVLVAARTAGKRGDRQGLSLFLVDRNADGMRLQSYPNNDGSRAADIRLEAVKVPASALLGECDTAFEAIQSTLNEAVVALAAESIGVVEKLLNTTVEYCKVREQFDQPISRFQVLQHRMAEMFMECEQLRSMVYFGAMTVPEGGANASRAASLLKVKMGSAGRLVGQLAVQLHGGMGVTEELDVGHYFKRITMMNTLLGSHDEHLQRLIDEVQAA